MIEHVDVHPLDVAHKPHAFSVWMRAHVKQGAVLAGEPDRGLPMAVQPADDVGVDLAEQDHLRDLDRRGIRDAHALDELHLHAQALHVVSDVGPAAVHDHGVQPHVFEEHHVGREALLELLVAHRGAAVLDDHGSPVELPDVRERLKQRRDAPW